MSPQPNAEIAMVSFGIFVFTIVWLGLILLGLFAFWLWMLIHALRNPGLSDGERVAWTLVLVFTHALGAILYFFIGRPKASSFHPLGQGPAATRPSFHPSSPPSPPSPATPDAPDTTLRPPTLNA
ncbi:MAG: PLD nuclease N-terminal domain-containing protein [Verrucomicrobiota bacterium]|nr:PLD nuclease N-terminal domain-containing protein [Limisphaera sp.]MDW8381281.1 PLD nuclease N-terminal domain-containing protein [Verrucomicrobiota bacterium]